MTSDPSTYSYCLGDHCACQHPYDTRGYHGSLDAYDRHQALYTGSGETMFYHPEHSMVLGPIQPPILTFKPYPYRTIGELNIILPSKSEDVNPDSKAYQGGTNNQSSSGTLVSVKEQGTTNVSSMVNQSAQSMDSNLEKVHLHKVQ